MSAESVRLVPSARARGAKAYARGVSVTGENALKLDANEGPLSLVPAVRDLPSLIPAALREYPDVSALEDLLAERLGVSRGALVVTAGGDDALARIAASVLEGGTSAVATTPTFEMIPRYVRQAGADLREISWFDGRFPVDRVLGAIDGTTRAVFVVSPNNPTGNTATAEDLVAISRAAPAALLVCDFAYAEFADQDLTAAALDLPNAVVVRTLSKAWGLAGLRVGYAAGPPEVVSWLRAVGQPYAVSGPSAAIAGWAMTRLRERMEDGVRAVKQERAELARVFSRRGEQVVPSQANFVCVRTDRAALIADSLARSSIIVRRFTGRPELESCLRITCPGDAAAFARLLEALENVP